LNAKRPRDSAVRARGSSQSDQHNDGKNQTASIVRNHDRKI